MPSERYIELINDMRQFHPSSAENVKKAAVIVIHNLWNTLTEPGSVTIDNLLPLALASFVFVAKQKNTSMQFVLDDMINLHTRKNAGYSGLDNPDPWANFRLCEVFGIAAEQGVLTRMSDKYSRFVRLQENADNEQVGEAIEDTVIDLAAYSLILVCLIEERAQK